MNWQALSITVGIIALTFLAFYLLARKDKKLLDAIQAKKELIVPIAPRYGLAILATFITLGMGIYLMILGNGYLYEYIKEAQNYEIYYLIFSTLLLIILVITVLVLMLKKCTKGKLKIDEEVMSWKIDSQEGKIVWNKPFIFVKHQAWRKIISKYPTAASAMVCEIQQDSNKLRFFIDAPASMTERLEITQDLGIYFHIYGLEIIRRIEEHI
ncbi:MAG: hypothetical protein AAB373_02660 [Patescibacteria group bacterium]